MIDYERIENVSGRQFLQNEEALRLIEMLNELMDKKRKTRVKFGISAQYTRRGIIKFQGRQICNLSLTVVIFFTPIANASNVLFRDFLQESKCNKSLIFTGSAGRFLNISTFIVSEYTRLFPRILLQSPFLLNSEGIF